VDNLQNRSIHNLTKTAN